MTDLLGNDVVVFKRVAMSRALFPASDGANL
jgi:hypothetical protein